MLGPKGVAITQDSNYAKELRKYEATHTQYGPPGRPYVYREYPKRLYKAAYEVGKGTQIVGFMDVQNEEEERRYAADGFHFGQDKAMAAIQRQQTEFATLAAERNWEIAHGRVSEKAASEVRQAEADHGAQHLPSVPVTPIKRRGRPRKAEPVPATV